MGHTRAIIIVTKSRSSVKFDGPDGDVLAGPLYFGLNIAGIAMPFISSFEDQEFDKDSEQRPEGPFEYIPPEAYRYKDVNEELTGCASAMLGILRDAGATELRVNYDGGSDEGFAHPDTIRIKGVLIPVETVVTELNTPQTAQRIATSGPGFFANSRAESQRVEDAVLELADAFASRLLGEGYGTGEYTMYGAFSVDLGTLEITDDENARPKSGI